MALGTAPRRVSPGVWKTRTGRTLSLAGSAYWENHYRAGRTDGRGHITRPSVVIKQPPKPKPRTTTPGRIPLVSGVPTVRQASPTAKSPPQGMAHDSRSGTARAGWLFPSSSGLTPAQRRQAAIYKRHQQATAQQAAENQARIDAQFGGVIPAAKRAYKTIDPAAGAVISAISPGTAALETFDALRHHRPLAAGVAAMGVLPFGFGPKSLIGAERIAKAAEAASAAERYGTPLAEVTPNIVKRARNVGRMGPRTLKAGELEVPVTRARSRVTQHLIERPADAFSRMFPNAPRVGERARALKHKARGRVFESGAAKQVTANDARIFPKKGSDSSAAHFYWSHLPESHHNVKGLEATKAGLQTELDRTLRGQPLSVQKKASQSLVAKRARVARLQSVYDKAVGRLGPGMTSPTVTKLGGALSVAKDDLATAEKRFALPRRTSKAAVAKLPSDARNLALKIAQLDRIIAKNPVANPDVINTVRAMGAEHARVLQEAGLLEGVDQQARKALVAHWLGVTPSGQEAYVGHRLGRVRGSGGLRSIGLGKPAKPMGAVGRNRLRLMRTGAVRADVHVAAEDLQAAQTYRDALKARQDLWQAGDPFPGHLPDGYLLVNPEGQVVPAAMKTDVLGQVADSPEELAAHIPSIEERGKGIPKEISGYLGDQSNWKRIVADAKATGKLDKLRIIKESEAKRYYAQILPAGQRTLGGKVYDKVIDTSAASLIFGRLGYVPKNILQNLITAIPHQGVFFPLNLTRAGQLIPKPGQTANDRKLWNLLVHATGGGVSGSVAQEATTKVISKPASIVTAVADNPFRVSALLHEAAAQGVISKVSFHLDDAEKQALLAWTSTPEFQNASQIARDAMGDFNRLTPVQRRWARRFLIVPGWIAAGTRYPIHFALTHPGRTAALAYAAAGEPGADKLGLPQNKPIDEYLTKGLPSYIRGVGVGGGKVERVGSLLPASLPADVGLAASQGDSIANAITGYQHPLIDAAQNIIHSTYQTPSGETKKTTFMDALTSNLQSLAPSEKFLQGEIAPSSVRPSKVYPDRSRLGLLAREAGVVPVKVDPQAAQLAQFSERGMTKSVQALKDQQAFFKSLDDAGYEPDPSLAAAYKTRLERARRLDAIHAHGLTYQQKAYRADVAYALKLGKIDKAEARSYLADLTGATEPEISSARNGMSSEWFGGTEISQAKRQLREAG